MGDFTSRLWAVGDRFNVTAANGLEDRISAASGGGVVVNAKSFPGIDPTGVADSTTALQNAINSTPAGGTIFLPRGTYKVTTLTWSDDYTFLVGEGKDNTIIKGAPTSVGSAVLYMAGRVGCGIVGITLDGQSHANSAVGVYNTGNGFDKNLTIRDCCFKNFNTTNGAGGALGQACAVYSWTADNVWIDGCDFISNNYDIFMDSPGPDCRVTNNRIWSTGGHTGRLVGISIRNGTNSYSGALVQGNTIEDCLSDPGGLGIYGHAINLTGSKFVRVIGNTTNNTLRAGIHVGGGCHGSVCDGNSIRNAANGNAAGIYVELNIGDTSTGVGADGRDVGAVISNNTLDIIGTYGIALSYSAGCTVTGNRISKTQAEAIFSDSDHATIIGNEISNCYLGDAAPSPSSTPNVQALIRVTTGNRCVVGGNNFTRSSTGTAPNDYCIAMGNGFHKVYGNTAVGGSNGAFATALIHSGLTGTINNWYQADTYQILASAATIAPNYDTNFLELSGTTTVTTMTTTWKGHVVTLILKTAVQITDGTNLTLVGNFTGTTAPRTLTLVCDGTQWIEISRSST